MGQGGIVLHTFSDHPSGSASIRFAARITPWCVLLVPPLCVQVVGDDGRDRQDTTTLDMVRGISPSGSPEAQHPLTVLLHHGTVEGITLAAGCGSADMRDLSSHNHEYTQYHPAHYLCPSFPTSPRLYPRWRARFAWTMVTAVLCPPINHRALCFTLPTGENALREKMLRA